MLKLTIKKLENVTMAVLSEYFDPGVNHHKLIITPFGSFGPKVNFSVKEVLCYGEPANEFMIRVPDPCGGFAIRKVDIPKGTICTTYTEISSSRGTWGNGGEYPVYYQTEKQIVSLFECGSVVNSVNAPHMGTLTAPKETPPIVSETPLHDIKTIVIFERLNDDGEFELGFCPKHQHLPDGAYPLWVINDPSHYDGAPIGGQYFSAQIVYKFACQIQDIK